MFIYILSNIFLANIINRFMYLFYEKCRVNKYIEFCIYSAYFVLITFIFLFFGNLVITISFNILSIFIFTLLYDHVNFRKSSVVTFLTYLILFAIEISVLTLTNFNRNNLYMPYKYRNILGFLSMYIIAYTVFYFLFYMKKFYLKKLDLIFSRNFFGVFIFIPIISVVIIFTIFLLNNNILFIIILNLFVLFVNVFIFKYCDIILMDLYEKIFDKILKDKVNGYKKEINIFKNGDDFKKYIISNNDFIDGILNSKISSLNNENDIKFKIDILIEKNLNISSNDLLIIIGNLMDNAISGVKSTLKNKDKYIDVKIKYLKGTVIINIKNSFNDLVNNKGLFNKKGKFEGYGLGLLSVKDVVEKYNGILDIKFNKNNFEAYILMYDIKV